VSSGGEDLASEHGREGARGLCPYCGSVCEPDQEYCLACGERLFEPVPVGVAALGRLQSALPFSDKDWAWPVLIALAVAILASSVAILTTRGSKTHTLQALGPPVQTTTSGASGSGTTVERSGTTTSTKPPKPPIKASGVIAWPGPPAYTVVLASLPLSSGKEGARQKALEAIDAGLSDVGVLKSSDFSSLHPGYFVVFSGVFETQNAALGRRAAARRAGFNSPYVKRVAS
jgi:hypothetical protein